MRLSSFRYYISSALESMFKNRLMSFASIITVSSCIAIFILSFSIASNIDYFLEQLEGSIGFTTFFYSDISEDRAKEVQKEIESIEHVEKVDFISKADALERMKQWMSDDKAILEGLEEDNPLPVSLDIFLDSARNQGEVVQKIKELDLNKKEIEKISATDVTSIVTLNNAVRIVSIIVIIAMGAISIVIIMNTIKLTVNNRRREINIMKYVGATDWFIKWPFVLEGIFIGFIGAVIPVVMGYFFYDRGIVVIQDKLSFISKIGQFKSVQEIFIFVIPIALTIGILIGVIGSVTSMRKHLQV